MEDLHMAPISLHPQNPHYFLFRGAPTVLVGSGEHYGAVLNLDFDYARYLDAVRSAGLNLTRTFSGTYREIAGSFKIGGNTLAPAPDRFCCPWARSDEPGETLGGKKFDLSRYDEQYFARLKDFVAQAGKRGIVVEFVLFCVLYNDDLWRANPMWAGNNVNGVGRCERLACYNTSANDLLPFQLDFVRRVSYELASFDNLYYEIMNEPYITDRLTSHDAWQRRVIEALVEAESRLPRPHLIAKGIANRSGRTIDPHPAVSIFNFHYSEPAAALENYDLGRAIANDEDGFKGQNESPYRRENWGAILSGMGCISHLDYSFTVEHPDGTAPVVGETPGYGGPEMRRQLRVLKDFIEGLDFLHMAPAPDLVRARSPENAKVCALAKPGETYALYVDMAGEGCAAENVVALTLDIPPGAYRAEWVDPLTGATVASENLLCAPRSTSSARESDAVVLSSPRFVEDIALRILRKD